MADTIILPIRLDSYAGEVSALEAHFFKDGEDQYGSKSVPDESMWVAVPIVNGKVNHDDIDYGYESLEELLKTYEKKGIRIIGLNENGKDAKLEEARAIAEDALGLIIDEDQVLLHVEGELNLPDGALLKAFRMLQKARKGGAKLKKGIDRKEVFYSLCNEDILIRAKDLGVPRKRLTPEIIKKIQEKVNDRLGSAGEDIQDSIADVMGEQEAQP